MDRIQKRFDELAEHALAIEGSVGITGSPGNATKDIDVESAGFYSEAYQVIDGEAFIWQTSVLSLLSRVFGEDSPTYGEFKKHVERRPSGSVRPKIHKTFQLAKATFLSAKEQFEGGYLFDVRSLIHAEVFDDELEQATYFLNQGHMVPAAVIAGTVLEASLREGSSLFKVHGKKGESQDTGRQTFLVVF